MLRPRAHARRGEADSEPSTGAVESTPPAPAGISSAQPGLAGLDVQHRLLLGSPAAKLWLGTISRVPRNLALDGLSNGAGDPFSPSGPAGKRSCSCPSGPITPIWLAFSSAM